MYLRPDTIGYWAYSSMGEAQACPHNIGRLYEIVNDKIGDSSKLHVEDDTVSLRQRDLLKSLGRGERFPAVPLLGRARP